MTALSDLLNDAKGEQSIDHLIDRAQADGHSVDRATIYKALRGQHSKKPREETLQSFAAVFGLDVRDVREAAGRPRGEQGPWVPVPESAQLGVKEREALDHLVAVMVSQEGSEQVVLRAVGERNLIIADLLAGGDGTGLTEADRVGHRAARDQVAEILKRRRDLRAVVPERHLKAARKTSRKGSNAPGE